MHSFSISIIRLSTVRRLALNAAWSSPTPISIFEGLLTERYSYPVPVDCLLTSPVQAALGKHRAALLPIFPLSSPLHLP
jgi:hypothetical protein